MIHGNATAYDGGCRCEKCATYRYRYAKDYRRRAALTGLQRPPADHVRARITQWQTEGFTAAAVARAAHLDPSITRAIVRGANRYIQRGNANAIMALTRVDLYDRVPDQSRVPIVGALRRINALRALGWPTRDIACPQVSRGYLLDLLYGRFNTISAKSWRAIRDRYDRLSMTPGPSDVTRHRCAELPPPLAWDDDDIDDPAAKPWKPAVYGIRSAIDPSDIDHLLNADVHPDVIASRLGVRHESIVQQLRRTGHHELLRRLVRARKVAS